MTLLDQFLWVIYPYIMLTLFVAGHIYRYNTDQFGWSAKSSEFLEKRRLRWGSVLFHWGILFVFLGHVAGILVPKAFYESIGITEEMYHFGAVWFGGAAGIATVIGVVLLLWRRLSVRRLLRHSSKSDLVVLLLLTIVILTGFTNTVGYTATGGTFDYRDTIGPWFRGILTFRPLPQLVSDAPIGFQIHILSALLLFGIWPFTRLVHVWSVPLTYLNRHYVVYRRMRAKKI
ncbi:respiratory nitrate reductase subunit gamma [Geobacillus sp. FSL K6-0789]|uniref:Respiratory nitrate reductase gamma chain n=1 Tax=Geobacillus stearothermophilus TaxID=1422 RepID=A0A0K9HIS1_GEOSE|nr:respiratory nitrate reductase subunit gamma [Geobacillus stearothermophilus]KAF6510960.1 Respiratory nitrate reductase gamma chain [Geobacillus stearothermophilus]KMY57390.1 nitrate reductase [Geobacillus stearothermophilus]KMY58791.1 nitrate reductase [Geobacillus stearothermophilus]KMY60802.1 nitrate reductase [Geobacillus stearothermophilus]KOR94401.1 nitrate reductase [Geobacillus stearothermophilus ATCC 12980]